MPSLFSLAGPTILVFQIWFVVDQYLLPFLLYATWASLAMMDLWERACRHGKVGDGVHSSCWYRWWAARGIC